LSNWLRRLVPFLREKGIQVILPHKGGKGSRILYITKKEPYSTATTATSATSTRVMPQDQSPTKNQAGGGSRTREAVDEVSESQPPPNDGAPNPLKKLGEDHGVAEVAEVAVDYNTVVVKSRVEKTSPYCCAACGPIEWKWNGNAWVCPNCGAPAPNQSGTSG